MCLENYLNLRALSFIKIAAQGFLMRFVLLISLLLFSPLAFAVDPLFGPEHTFTNNEVFSSYPSDQNLITTQTARKYLDQMIEEVKNRLTADYKEGGWSITFKEEIWSGTQRRPIYTVTLPNGYYLKIFSDPGVIESTAMPVTRRNYEQNHVENVQRYLFDAAAKVGLIPWDFAGAGHIHMGAKGAFGKNTFLYRQFDVDFRNHPGLAMGALNHDRYNAIALAELPESNRTTYRNVIAEFDAGHMINVGPSDLARMIQSRAYKTTDHDPIWNESNKFWKYRPGKYHELHLRNMYKPNEKERTIELRAVRPQQSAYSYLKLQILLERRLKYLSKIKHPIPYLNKTPPSTPHEVMQEFYEYVTSAGLDFEQYKEFLMPEWHQQGFVENFKPNRKFKPAHKLVNTPCLTLKGLL